MQSGYDLNGANGTLDADAAARSGRWFGMPKATEGGDWNDPAFSTNRSKILAAHAGRCVPYHFARPDMARGFYVGSPDAAAVELRHIIDVVGALGPNENVMVDFEEPLGYRSDTTLPPYINLGAWLWTLCDGLRQHYGRAPIVYTFADFWHRHVGNDPRFVDFPLNLAAYQLAAPTPPTPWVTLTFWQDTSNASIPGIAGRADEDLFYGDQPEWDRMCGLVVPPSEEPMRDKRTIHVPAPDANGEQIVAVDVNGALLAKESLTSSVQIYVQGDGRFSDLTIQVGHYLDLLLLYCRNLAGTGPATQGNVDIVIEHR